jgi:hypothetical protein
LAPLVDGDDTIGREFENGVEADGVVDAGPGIGINDGSGHGSEEPDSIWYVGEDDDDANDEEANEARFGGVSGGD